MVWFSWTPRAQAPSGLSVAAERNTKACRKLLRSFTKIHNSLRSDNGFLLITQFPAGQEFLLRFHRKSGGCMHAGLVVKKMKNKKRKSSETGRRGKCSCLFA